jgi:hypothetical protein
VGEQASAGSAGVTFRVSVPVSEFAAASSLRVQVWTEEQLAALERNARCSVTHDPTTGLDQVQCPPGVTWESVAPEEVEVPVPDPGGSVSVPTSVRVGGKFRVLVSGRSVDGCNTTSADRSGTATSPEVVLDGLSWRTTALACAP